MSGDTRLKPNMSVNDVVKAMAGSNPGAILVILQLLKSHPSGLNILLLMDTKHLYGNKIWDLYTDVCGSDIDRFVYHVDVELPNQLTGEAMFTGPHVPDDGTPEWEEFKNARRFGTPNSWWTLQEPPTNPNYSWPIRTVDGRVVGADPQA